MRRALCKRWWWVWASLFLSFLCGCTPGLPAQGQVGGQTIRTGVDTDEARYYLQSYLAGQRLRPALDQRIDRVYAASAGQVPDRNELKRLSQLFSIDFASLFFADRLSHAPGNPAFQQVFDDQLKKTRAALNAGVFELPAIAQQYEVLFVPGFLYERHSVTGADFAAPREALERVGMPFRFLPTDEDGPIEANAELIYQALLETSSSGRRLILVSASKSGPEVALALTRLGLQRSGHVAAWLNLVGTMQGSYLADQRLAGGMTHLVNEVDVAGVTSLSVTVSRDRFQSLKVPEGLLVVNYLGVPVSGSLSFLAYKGYRTLKDEGPNDGLSLLPDLLAPTGLSLIELGSDHFLLTKDIEVKTIALAVTLIEWLERVPPANDTVKQSSAISD